MATAEELLAGVSESDKTLVISNDLRTINIPSSVTTLGVESDDDVLRLKFKMPRYVSDTDLSAFSIRINYVNAKGESDAYTVSDAVVGAQYITFSWLVGPVATAYKGNTSFIVCMKTLTSDGVIDREFNTTIATLPVLEGLEVDEGVVTQYSDIIEQWRRELFGIGDTEEASIKAVSAAEQEAIANKGAEVLATIPVDYQTAVSMTDNVDRTKADAIICTARGETISVSDSSDDYLRGLKILGKTTQVTTTGKNLLDLSEFEFSDSQYIHTFTQSDSTTANSLYDFLKQNTGATVVLSASVTGTASGEPIGNIRFYDGNGALLLVAYLNKSFTIPEIADAFYSCYVYGSTTGASAKNFQIEFGEVATAYEPYSGGVVSPSPEWPQELINIQPLNAMTYGKNMCAADLAIGTENVTIADFGKDMTFDALTFSIDLVNASVSNFGTALINFEKADGTPYYITSSTAGLTANTIYTKRIKAIARNVTCRRIICYFKSNEYGIWSGEVKNAQLELETVVTDYEPYVDKQTFAINRSLPGIPVASGGNYTDSDGQQWICDEVDFERGVYVQRVGTKIVDGTEKYSDYTADGIVSIPLVHQPTSSALCTHGRQGVEFNWANDTYVLFRVAYFNATTLDEFKAYIIDQYNNGTPVTVQYVLATPIETPLTAEEIEAFRFAHTNYPNTTIFNDAGVTMELKYNADTMTWLDNYVKDTMKHKVYIDNNILTIT